MDLPTVIFVAAVIAAVIALIGTILYIKICRNGNGDKD